MSKHTTRACSGFDRTSLYDEITTKIIAELEAGRVPWVGTALGHGRGKSAARHAEQRQHRPVLFRDRLADPLGLFVQRHRQARRQIFCSDSFPAITRAVPQCDLREKSP